MTGAPCLGKTRPRPLPDSALSGQALDKEGNADLTANFSPYEREIKRGLDTPDFC